MNKLLASLILTASSALAVNAIAATDKADEPTAATQPDKKAKKSQEHKSSHSTKKSTHKSDAKPADAKPAEAASK